MRVLNIEWTETSDGVWETSSAEGIKATIRAPDPYQSQQAHGQVTMRRPNGDVVTWVPGNVSVNGRQSGPDPTILMWLVSLVMWGAWTYNRATGAW